MGNLDREVHITRMYTSYYLYNLPVSFEPRSYGSPMCYTHVRISNRNDYKPPVWYEELVHCLEKD